MPINIECNTTKYTTPSSPPRLRRGNRPNLDIFQYAVFQYRDGGEVDNFKEYSMRNMSN